MGWGELLEKSASLISSVFTLGGAICNYTSWYLLIEPFPSRDLGCLFLRLKIIFQALDYLVKHICVSFSLSSNLVCVLCEERDRQRGRGLKADPKHIHILSIYIDLQLQISTQNLLSFYVAFFFLKALPRKLKLFISIIVPQRLFLDFFQGFFSLFHVRHFFLCGRSLDYCYIVSSSDTARLCVLGYDCASNHKVYSQKPSLVNTKYF